MKDLVGSELLAVARMVQQIAVAFAECVVDFNHNGAQLSVCRVAIPEANRLEGVAQYTRIGVQPDLAERVFYAFAL